MAEELKITLEIKLLLMSSKKSLYYSFTALFSILVLLSSGLFILKFDLAQEWFMNMGIHPFMVFPIAFAQILGVVLLWSKIHFAYIKWVYLGFASIFVFAALSHFIVNDGFAVVPIVMGIILFLSYKFRAGFSILEVHHGETEEEI